MVIWRRSAARGAGSPVPGVRGGRSGRRGGGGQARAPHVGWVASSSPGGAAGATAGCKPGGASDGAGPAQSGATPLSAPPRRFGPRHSDGMFTSELSRLQDSARLQRLLQGLVGKRSEQDTENIPENSLARSKPLEDQLCLLWSNTQTLQDWLLPRLSLDGSLSLWLPPGPRSAVDRSEWTETTRPPR